MIRPNMFARLVRSRQFRQHNDHGPFYLPCGGPVQHLQIMKFITQASLLAIALFLGSCAKEKTQIISVAKDDAEMNAAIAEAQRTLPRFWDEREKEKDRFIGLLKVYFTDPGIDDSGEHMWVQVTKHDPKQNVGVLVDVPGWLKSVKEGDTIQFPDSKITDWLFVQNHRAEGAFTVKLLRKRMSPEERRAHDESYPFTFE